MSTKLVSRVAEGDFLAEVGGSGAALLVVEREGTGGVFGGEGGVDVGDEGE